MDLVETRVNVHILIIHSLFLHVLICTCWEVAVVFNHFCTSAGGCAYVRTAACFLLNVRTSTLLINYKPRAWVDPSTLIPRFLNPFCLPVPVGHKCIISCVPKTMSFLYPLSLSCWACCPLAQLLFRVLKSTSLWSAKFAATYSCGVCSDWAQ